MSWIHYIWVFVYLALVIIVFILATLKKKKSLPIEENTPFVRRFFVLYIIITLAFAAIIYQLVDIQYAQGEQLRAISQKHFPQADTITAKRGNILSDDGRLLSSSIPYYYLYFDTRVAALHEVNKKTGKTYFDEHVGELAQALAQKFGGKASEQEKKLRKAFRQKKSAYRLHPKAVSYLDYIEIKQFPILKRGAIQGGFSVKERIIRERPFGSLASRTIGGIYGIEGKGKNGLELAYDSLLRGDYGLAIRRKKAGKTVQIITKEPQDGIDVVSTINIDIQETAERALRERLTWSESERGCVVLMEVATGKIKAISNLQWNPATKQYEEAQNIAVASQIEPGSTFKTMSFLTAIEDGYIDSTTLVDTQDGKMKFSDRIMRDHNNRGFGIASVATVMHQSSNVGVSALIVKHYGTNPQKFLDGIHRLGITKPIQMEIPGHGRVKLKKVGNRDWYGTTLPWMSIGYEAQVPPIYTLMLYNAIANGGTMVKPLFTEKFLKDGKVYRTTEVEVVNPQIASPNTIRQMQGILEGVVKKGTAKNMQSPLFTSAGKTGTSQIFEGGTKKNKEGKTRHQFTFCGYFPADKPVYSCIVYARDPKQGGTGSICGEVYKQVAEKAYILHTHQQDSIAANNWDLDKAEDTVTSSVLAEISNESILPNLTGWNLDDALYLLENMGISVQPKGFGRIKSQSVQAGTPTEQINQITLICDNL
ncbi:MAG: penicillin-binding protein [Paludibacteraceae bacterium]|nr:penicillin-binding protein [Paludibacteraceae bacterium]